MTQIPQFDATKPLYEYRITYAIVPADFPKHDRISEDMAKIAPKPPKAGLNGTDWQLAGNTAMPRPDGTTLIIYQWERPTDNRGRGE